MRVVQKAVVNENHQIVIDAPKIPIGEEVELAIWQNSNSDINDDHEQTEWLYSFLEKVESIPLDEQERVPKDFSIRYGRSDNAILS